MQKLEMVEVLRYVVNGLIGCVIFLLGIIAFFAKRFFVDTRDERTRINQKVDEIDDRLIVVETTCKLRGKDKRKK